MSQHKFVSRILMGALTGSVSVAVVVSQTMMVASAKSTKEVAQIATQVTVRINPAGQSGGGSGVIISKKAIAIRFSRLIMLYRTICPTTLLLAQVKAIAL